jgi:predicted RNA-binding Zn ribbon-like protein
MRRSRRKPERPLVGVGAGVLRLLGGRPCLDFCNTIDPREGPRAVDHLTGYADVLQCARRTGLLSSRDAAALHTYAKREASAAQRSFRSAIRLRGALHRIFTSVVREQAAPREDLAFLGSMLARAAASAGLIQNGRGFVWSWIDRAESLERPLWLIARSAGDLLTSGELARVEMCAAPYCGWIFLDQSKNRSRRWCSMEGCGSRQKMRRLYARRRAGRGRSV